MSTDTREERLARRIADLYATDPQFAAAAPERGGHRRRRQPGLRLPRSCGPSWRATPTGPRSGQRAVEFVTDPGPAARCRAAARSSRPSPTASCGTGSRGRRRLGRDPRPARRPGRHPRLHQRRLHHHRHRTDPARRGLGPAADQRAGRPAAADRHRDRARVIASSIDYLADAVELIADRPRAQRGWWCSTTTPRSTTSARPRRRQAHSWPKPAARRRGDPGRRARARRRRCQPRHRSIADDADDPLALLIYTSGSTGAPKGAMYPRAQGRQHVARSRQFALGRTSGDRRSR